MTKKQTVIKDAQVHPPSPSTQDEETPPPRRHPVRIPSQQVQAEDLPSKPKHPSRTSDLLQGVLRGKQARMATQPFELPVVEGAAANPVPQPSSSESGETNAAAETDEDGPSEREKELRAAWEAEWNDRLDDAVAQARSEGYEEGYAAAKEELQAEFDERKATLASDLVHLESLWNDFIEQCEPVLAELALDVAEALLDAPLPQAVKAASARAITQAIEELSGEPPITVSLHPVDYLRLEETGVADQLNASHERLRWNTDSDLEHGEWIVESPAKAVRHLTDELLRTLKSRLGLLATAQNYPDR